MKRLTVCIILVLSLCSCNKQDRWFIKNDSPLDFSFQLHGGTTVVHDEFLPIGSEFEFNPTNNGDNQITPVLLQDSLVVTFSDGKIFTLYAEHESGIGWTASDCKNTVQKKGCKRTYIIDLYEYSIAQ